MTDEKLLRLLSPIGILLYLASDSVKGDRGNVVRRLLAFPFTMLTYLYLYLIVMPMLGLFTQEKL